jgi:L-ascorbate peroxidase
MPAERAAVDAAFASTLPKTRAPVCLRLVFHDAGTFDANVGDGGANASIQFELERPENFGLKRGWNVIVATADKLRGSAAESLSMADIIALAGAHAVRITGGPLIEVPVGRKDASTADAEGRLPAETLSAVEQLATFRSKGFSPREFIALAGAHTLGNKGFGEPLTFDNAYYTALLRKPWENKNDSMASMIGLPSDHVLPDDPTCRPLIAVFAADQKVFFDDFAAAYTKLTMSGANWA